MSETPEDLEGNVGGEDDGEDVDSDGDDDDGDYIGELRNRMSDFFLPSQTHYSSIDIILAKESFTLEDLFEQDDFLPDLRQSRQVLINYLRDKSTMKKLVHYIATEEREEETSEPDKRKRFAHLAYEALQTEAIKEYFIAGEELLDEFFGFLDIAIEMDPLRCAYFSRLVELLFERYPAELIAYLKKKNCVVAKFVWHINNQYIAESLFRLIDSQISHQWLTDEDLIPLLMFKMAQSEEEEIQENTASVFVEILDLLVPFPYSVLTTSMFGSDVVAEQWEHYMTTKIDSSTRIQNGLNVAIAILNLSFEGNMADKTPIFMTTACKYVEYLISHLKIPAQASKSFQMTFGTLSPPFGFLRLKILEFIAALVNTRYPSIHNTLWETKSLFSVLLDVLIFYKWNNTLHFFVNQIFSTIISVGMAAQIKSVLLDDCKLVAKILHVFAVDTSKTSGYLGHISDIANSLYAAGEKSADLKLALEACEGWKEFVSGKLKEVNRINSIEIAGGKPKNNLPAGTYSDEMLAQFSRMGMGKQG